MSALIKAFPRIHIEGRRDPFLTLARSIVGQQISVHAAASIWNRLLLASPSMLPGEFLRMREFELRACGLSRRKIEYIVDLAAGFSDGRIRPSEWRPLDDEQVVSDLVRIRGIGRWTAEMFLMFNLLRPDILPLDDRGLQKAVEHYYFFGHSVSREEILQLANEWRPWRSVATWYLWRSLEPIPVDY